MSSVLAQQLQALGVKGHALPRPKGRAPLLFADQQAADIDLQTVHELGSQGLAELGEVNEAFRPFAYTLFRQDRIGLDTNQQTRAANDTIQQSVESLLTMLSPYFMRDAATRVLEFLIRQYRVNEQNVEALMACALPYHSTLHFVRLVQAMRLEGTWSFMAPMQRSGAPMPRSMLAQRCMTDAALLDSVCRAAQQAAASPTGCNMWMSFYSVLVSEVLTKLPKEFLLVTLPQWSLCRLKVEEKTAAQLLPFLLPGLKAKDRTEYQLATYMLLMRLITRCSPSPQLFDVCILEVAKGAQKATADAPVMVLAGLFKTQAGMPHMTPKVLKHIQRMPSLVDHLAQRPKESARLLHSLIRALLTDRVHTATSLDLLGHITSKVDLGGLTQAAAQQILSVGPGAEGEELQKLMSVFRSLDIRYADKVGAAVTKALKQAEGHSAAAEGTGAEQLKVTQFVQSALTNQSARAPLQGAAITLAQAIDSPSADLRHMAVSQLDQLDSPDQEWLVSVLLRRLADENLDVAAAALSTEAALQLPAAALFEAVAQTSSRAWEALLRKDQGISSAKAQAVVKNAISLLTGPFHEANPSFRGESAQLLLGYVIVMPSLRKLGVSVLKAAGSLEHPLLAGLTEIASELQESTAKSADLAGRKPSKAQLIGNSNRKIISTLAASVRHDQEALAAVEKAARGQGRSMHAAMMILACAAASMDAVHQGGLAAATVGAALAPESALSSHLESLPEDVAEHFREGLPSDLHLAALAAEPAGAAAAAQHHALLLALQRCTPAVLGSQPGGARGLFRQLIAMAGASTDSLRPHMGALLLAVEQETAPAVFLTEELGGSMQSAAAQVQVLRLFSKATLAPRRSHKAADTSACFHRVLPALLAAAAAPDRAVRAAALDAVQALSASVKAGSSHAEGTLTGTQLEDLTAAIQQKRDFIEADQEALPTALLLALQQSAEGFSSDSSRALELSAASATALSDYFLAVLPHQRGGSGAAAARLILASLQGAAQPAACLRAASTLLQHYLSVDLSEVSATERQLVMELLTLFTPEAVAGQAELPKARRAAGQAAEQVLLDVLGLPSSTDSQEPGQSLIRLAALTQLAGLYSSVAPGHQQQLIQAALAIFTQDPNESCRAAARELLRSAPVSAAALVPLLALPRHGPLPKRGRTAAKLPKDPSHGVAAAAGEGSMTLMTAVLELLQWKDVAEGAESLVQHLNSLLPALQRRATEQDSMAAETDGESTDRRAEGAYALQLALSALRFLLASQPEDGSSRRVSYEAVMDCIQRCSDRLVQNAALSLLGLLAAAMPQQHLTRLTEVALQPAAPGAAEPVPLASMRLMTSVAAAWAAQGFPDEDLIDRVVAGSRSLPEASRLSLFQNVLALLSSVTSLQHVCMALLREAALEELPEEGRAAALALATAIASQAEASARVQALPALLNAALQPSSSEAIAVSALQFLGNQVAAIVQSSAQESDEQQAQLQQLFHTSMTTLKEPSFSRGLGQALTGLTDALERAMPAGQFLECLIALASSEDSGVSRRALKLLTFRMTSLASSAEGPGTAEEAAGRVPAEAASALCRAVPGLLQANKPALLRQGALAALGTAASAFGRQHPAPFQDALPAALAAAKDEQAAVRSSAVMAVAECVSALGPRCLPQLGPILDTVLQAAEASLAHIGAEATSAADPKQEGQRKGSSTAGDAQSLECASAMAAVSALARGLGAFLAPQLPRMLRVLLDCRVLAESANGIAASAAAARETLTEAVPPRLLLPPLYAHLGSALQAGSRSAAELISMAERTVAALQPSAAARHADALFSFLQQALDVRQSAPAADAQPVERAAITALVTLVMKLNERQFKPLFLRLHAWSITHPVGQPDAEPLGRQAAFFGAVHALALRLRSVFVPYYRYIMDGAIAHLSSAAAADAQPKKKRKKSSLPAAEMPSAVDDPNGLRWVVRLRVLKALQACFQSDSGAFVTPELFKRLLPPLVSQLRGGPPAEAQMSLSADGAPGEPAAAEANAYGETAVETLVELAASASNDELWKPFNHQVLMVTRGRDAAERERALRVVQGVVDRVQENYLPLVPEMLPFLSELLEDPEIPIVARTQQLLKHLEQLSGEDLTQYMKH